MISCIDAFASQIKKYTIVVLDNASIHHSRKFRAHVEKWKKMGLELFYLPTYSPELNKIEILWKQMKYHWMTPTSYSDLDTLEQALYECLRNIGTKHVINFV